MLKIVSGVFLVAILAYVAVYLISLMKTGYQTATAVDYTVRDTISVYGVVVRDEEVLRTDYNSVYVSVAEGKRVAGGGTVGMVYRSDEELRRAERLQEINGQILSLQSMQEGGSTDSQKMESGIKSGIQALRTAAQNRELSELDSLTLNVRTLLFSTASDAGGVSAQLRALYSEAAELQTRSTAPYDVITAPASGLFSAALDGYETVTPASVENIRLAELKALINGEHEPPQHALGKLVYGSEWYYAAVMSRKEAVQLEVGDTVTMIFGRYYSEMLDMKVLSISIESADECAVLFSCQEAMADILSMRVQSAEIILSEDSGIRVPKKAVRVEEDGRIYVYVQTGMQAEKKYIVIRHEVGDYYVVSGETLRPGDTLIVSGKALYEGKVVG